MPDPYESSVLLNIPFDSEYEPIQRALIFSISDCGFRPRCALEIDDSSQNRLEKICVIMSECQYGIHDISRIQPSRTGLPRFNMPLELGLFLGAKRFGGSAQQRKNCLVLDEQPYRYQRFCSDIAGQDIRAHEGNPAKAIVLVRDWLAAALGRANIMVPGGENIAVRHAHFLRDLPRACHVARLNPRRLTYSDYLQLVTRWQKKSAL